MINDLINNPHQIYTSFKVVVSPIFVANCKIMSFLIYNKLC